MGTAETMHTGRSCEAEEVDKGASKVRVLSAAQVGVLRRFIPALLKRYRQVAQTGTSDLDDPVCATLKQGKRDEVCTACPVWGIEAECGAVLGRADSYVKADSRGRGRTIDAPPVEFFHCENYYPPRPQCVEDGPQGVSVSRSKDGGGANLAKARAWGLAVCEWLEGLQ